MSAHTSSGLPQNTQLSSKALAWNQYNASAEGRREQMKCALLCFSATALIAWQMGAFNSSFLQASRVQHRALRINMTMGRSRHSASTLVMQANKRLGVPKWKSR